MAGERASKYCKIHFKFSFKAATPLAINRIAGILHIIFLNTNKIELEINKK